MMQLCVRKEGGRRNRASGGNRSRSLGHQPAVEPATLAPYLDSSSSFSYFLIISVFISALHPLPRRARILSFLSSFSLSAPVDGDAAAAAELGLFCTREQPPPLLCHFLRVTLFEVLRSLIALRSARIPPRFSGFFRLVYAALPTLVKFSFSLENFGA